MRVVHVCRSGWPDIGGMESFVTGLAAAMAARGHTVDVITLRRSLSTGELLPEAEHRGVRYWRVRRVGPRRYPLALGLARAVAGAHLVHAHGLDGLTDLLVARRGRHGAAVGVSTHGGYLHTPRHRLLKAAFLRTVTRATLRRADAVWFTSEADAVSLAPSGAFGVVLPDGVDVACFAAVERAPEPGRWLVLGRVDVHKGVDDLLDTVAAAGMDPVIRLVGPERRPGLAAALVERGRRLGVRVVALGAVSHARVLEELARCEHAVFPSRYEGFGITVVEAMAAGVAPVVSDIPAHRALVTDGVDGWVVPFRHHGAATVLGRVRSDPVRAAAARAAAVPYGWGALAPRWEAAYRRVVDR